MARIRTIKPTFFTSLTIADLSVEQRLTFIGLWTHVDDAGRCIYDPRLLKAALWPLDDRTAADVADDVRALVEAELVTHYVLTEDSVNAQGALARRSFLSVNGWSEHQVINRPVPSKLPAPPEGEIRPLTSGYEDSLKTHGVLAESSVPERKGKERKGATSPSADAADDEDRFAEFWASYPRKVNKQDALRAWTKATKDVDPQVIINGVKRFEFTGDPKFIPHPATWLTNRRWEDERPTGRIEERLMYRCGPDQWRELYTDEVVDHSHLDRYEVRQVEVR